jgi:hypothetical protein
MLFRDMTQNRMNSFALVVLFFAFGYFFGGNTTLRQINVTYYQKKCQLVVLKRRTKVVGIEVDSLTLLFVNSEDDDNFISVDTNELLNGTNTSSRQFGEKNHSFSVIVFKLKT